MGLDFIYTAEWECVVVPEEHDLRRVVCVVVDNRVFVFVRVVSVLKSWSGVSNGSVPVEVPRALRVYPYVVCVVVEVRDFRWF